MPVPLCWLQKMGEDVSLALDPTLLSGLLTLAGLFAGVLTTGFLLMRQRAKTEGLRFQLAVLEERLLLEARNAEALLEVKSGRIEALEEALSKLTQTHQALLQRQTEAETRLESERSGHAQQLTQIKEAREELSRQFQVLATNILDEKSRRFDEINQTSLRQLLDPLKERIQAFQGKVEEVYVKEGQERSALAQQVRHLMTLNQQLSDDANNLTRALKGQAKVQGNWGELVLERILDAAGLKVGIHYETQVSHQRDDGSRAQPDVILKLPENRQLVIDAKVSLVAYEAFSSSLGDPEREIELKRHLDSLKQHIRGLSSKNYQDLYQLDCLDFVILFVPIEPAYMLAISEDPQLWQEAWERNVLLVSPSTLLFVVRTVSHLWRQEQQNRNAQDIARRGGELYDKLCGVVQDLETVGRSLDQASKAYSGALTKFSQGRGNLIRQAELLRELGVKPSKQLPQGLIDRAKEDEDLADVDHADA